jgi:hypothetical protein
MVVNKPNIFQRTMLTTLTSAMIMMMNDTYFDSDCYDVRKYVGGMWLVLLVALVLLLLLLLLLESEAVQLHPTVEWWACIFCTPALHHK